MHMKKLIKPPLLASNFVTLLFAFEQNVHSIFMNKLPIAMGKETF